MTALGILWFFAIFLLIAGYFVLDGFDLGIGVLYPFVAKGEKEQMIARRAVGPIWDGNEVWLLAAGGALFAAFPAAYATTFSGFYLAIMLVLFGLIVRAVCFEFWTGDSKWRGLWNVCFFIGSLLPALLFGVAIGNVFEGIPMAANGDYSGVALIGLITPFTLLTGVLGLVMCMAAGAAWLALKAPVGSNIQARAAKWRLPMQIIVAVVFVAVTAYVFWGIHPEMDAALLAPRIIFGVLFAAALIFAIVCAIRKSDLGSFLGQCVAAISLIGLLACSMFPDLVVAAADSVGSAITIETAAASELSLTCMTVVLCIGLPLVLIYHVIIYRKFRGRITEADLTD